VSLHIWFGRPPTLAVELAKRIPANAWEPMTILHQRLMPLSQDQVRGLLSAADREVVWQKEIAQRPLRDLRGLRQERRYKF
jgi:hypothetical protein